jgi:hypothetical protein
VIVKQLGDVIHVHTGHCHEYFVLHGDKLMACDGLGNPEPKNSASNKSADPRIVDKVRECPNPQ